MIRKLFRDSSALFFSQIVANIAAFSISWSIARGMGGEAYGIFAAAYALATALATIADSGVRLALIREVARSPHSWQTMLRHSLIVSLLTGLLLAVAVVLVIVLREGFSDAQQLRIWLLVFALLWIELRILTGVLAGRGQFVALGVWSATERMGGAIVIGTMVFLLSASLMWLAIGLCVWEGIVVLALAGWILKQRWPARPATITGWGFFRLAIPFGLAGIGTGILGKLDLIVLGFQQAPQSIGYYAAAQTLALAALFAVIALSSAMFPSLAEMARDGTVDEARSLLMPAMGNSMLLIMTLASVLIAGASHWLGWIYGAEFSNGAPWLVLFALTAAFPAIGTLFGSVVSAWGWQGRWARVVVMMLFIATPLFWFAGNRFGIPGVAVCAILVQFAPVLVIWRWICLAGLSSDTLWIFKVVMVQAVIGVLVVWLGIGHPLLWLLPLAVPAMLVAGGICRWNWFSRALALLVSGRRTA